MMVFNVKQASNDEVVLSVEGALTGETAMAFALQMDDLVAGKSSVVTLDLSRTPAINSAVIGKILAFRNKLAEQQRTLQIRGCSDNLYRLFQMTRIDSLMSITQ